MIEYKVISCAVSGSGNKIFKTGDLVNESHFTPGRAEDLANRGHLKRLKPVKLNFKIGVLIPTRGNRPVFLEQALSLINAQTRQPDHVEIISDLPLSEDIDVTYRYRIGCERLFALGCDVIIFWEDDDWYSPEYIELMIGEWMRIGRPSLFGIGQTVYYHIFSRRYMVLAHRSKASAMSTMVTRKIMDLKWPKDNDAYLDAALWKYPGKTWIPAKHICIGIKHNTGMVAGGAHNEDNAHYNKVDADGSWLRGVCGDGAEFYESLVMSGDKHTSRKINSRF
jgi:hypothetical protein